MPASHLSRLPKKPSLLLLLLLLLLLFASPAHHPSFSPFPSSSFVAPLRAVAVAVAVVARHNFFSRFDHQNSPIASFSRPAAQIAIPRRKKRRKREAFGREGSPTKLIFNPCILFCAHISYISLPSPATSRPDRFSPPPQATAHLNFQIGESLFSTTERTASSTSSLGRPDHQDSFRLVSTKQSWIKLVVLARLLGARPPVCFFDTWASRQAQSTTRAFCRGSQLHPSCHHHAGPRLATALSIEAATLSGSIFFLSSKPSAPSPYQPPSAGSNSISPVSLSHRFSDFNAHSSALNHFADC